MARTVAVVPHTHWDREWYQPFQVFRLKLVDLLDDLLPRLEADPSYARFMLDGQMAVVDDYLELRPFAEERLRRLAASGRLSMGPWYVLMDEFCVSGETMVRDLQLGLERAAAFGGAMQVGYLPDMFGHVAQMPQLLRLAGFDHAVVWRGVPSAVNRTAFWWSAPDGSTVRAEYLPVGYGNGAAMPDDAKALLTRIRAHEREIGDLLVGGMLWMNGTDHQTPQPWLGRVVAEANAVQDDYRIIVTSLPEYLTSAPTEGLPSWQGELRSGARANLLMGVASNRVDVKQAAALAERALERRAEPLSALFVAPEQWPDAELALAWKEMIRNSAHDSSCACSADEVVDAVLDRYAAARQIGDTLARKALRALAHSLADAGAYVVNPSMRTRGGVVQLLVPDIGPIDGTQLVYERPASAEAVELLGGEFNMVLARLRNDEIVAGGDIVAVEAEEVDGVYQVTLTTGVRRRP
ncbi:MAG: alpha-mannosidase, partial [Acidimicrobiia bacterium]|nr:alpha-mannosidase [Acidimicrobiia bacterium]